MKITDAIRYSFYKREFYNDAVKVSVRSCIAFIVLIAFLLSILIGIGVYKYSNKAVNDLTVMYENKQIPNITIKDGKLSTQPEEKFVMDFHGFKFIIDTKSQTVLEEQPANTILLTDTNIYQKISSAETRQYELKNIVKNFTLNEETVKKYKSTVMFWFVLLTWLFSFLYTIVSKTFQGFFFGVFTYIISFFLNKNLSYPQSVKITVFCLWPATFFSTLINSFRQLHGFWFLYLFIVLGYIIFAVHSQNYLSAPKTNRDR